jgi:cytochrome c oxidase assembly protein subunit 15
VRSRLQDRLPEITPERYARLAAVVFALFVVIVFTGAAVRVTGSGLGCPTWPKCTEATFYSTTTHAPELIEFGNRVITTLISIVVVLGVVAAALRRPFRRDLLVLSVLCFLGVVVQAVIGGLSVLYHLAPGWVMGHYGVSMITIIAAYGLYWRARREPWDDPVVADRVTIWATRGLLVLGGVAVFAGTAATAAGPHGGGAGTGDVVTRLYFKGDHTLDWIIHAHGYLVTALGIAAIATWFLARRRRSPRELQATLTRLCLLLAAQGALGILQYQLHLPKGLVWVHVILATLTWVGLVRAWGFAGPLPARAAQSALTARTVSSSS